MYDRKKQNQQRQRLDQIAFRLCRILREFFWARTKAPASTSNKQDGLWVNAEFRRNNLFEMAVFFPIINEKRRNAFKKIIVHHCVDAKPAQFI